MPCSCMTFDRVLRTVEVMVRKETWRPSTLVGLKCGSALLSVLGLVSLGRVPGHPEGAMAQQSDEDEGT